MDKTLVCVRSDPGFYGGTLVAIFGDTSDENNTDSEQLFKDLGNGSSSQTPEERQTAILDSEEDSEDVVMEQDVC
ncbi:hypothetical protein TELCIR_24715, partial [Teladorsagia circumcincta]